MKNSQRITPKIPDGMVELMKNLAKSVLKEQPENIYLFAAEYFENLVRERDGSLDKGYSTFRKYDDEIAKRRGLDVCPRCNCLLHPERKDDETAEGDGEEDNSPRNDGENTLDMSVNGVAIKAMPRDGKSSKGQKNRQRLETIRSVSMDSAIEDDGKSQSTSPRPNKQDKPNDSSLNLHGLSALSAINPNILNKNDGHKESTENTEKLSNETIQEESPVAESPVNEAIVESISNNKLSTDDDIPDTPTNDTSISETFTDRTVIEVAPLNNESKNDDLNTSDSTQTDDLDTNVKSNDTDTIPTVVTEQIDEQKSVNDDEIKTTEPINLQLEQVKQIDRLRTPESDSGLSEKSFNLNIQENEETVTNEVNEIEDDSFIKPEKLLSLKETEFDATSKDDSGIVDVEESLITSELNKETDISTKKQNEEIEESKPAELSIKDEKKTEVSAIEVNEQQQSTDNVDSSEKILVNKTPEVKENVLKEEITSEKVEVPKTDKSNDLKQQNEITLPATTESLITTNDAAIEKTIQTNELSSEEKKPSDSAEPDLKPNSAEMTDDNREKSETVSVTRTITPDQESIKSAEPTNDQKKPESAQSTPENVSEVVEEKSSSAEKPRDEPDLKQPEESQTAISNESDPSTSESKEIDKEQPMNESKSTDEIPKAEVKPITPANETTNDDNKSIKNATDEKSQNESTQDNKINEEKSDVKALSAKEETNDTEIATQRQASTDSNKKLEINKEKPNNNLNEGNKIDEINAQPLESIASSEQDIPKSTDQAEKPDDKLNEMPNPEIPSTPVQEEKNSTNNDELNTNKNSLELNNEPESSTEKILEEKNNKRNKREIGSIDDGSKQAETVDEKANDTTNNKKSASQEEEKQQSDTNSLDLKPADEKSSVNLNDAVIPSNQSLAEVEKHDKIPSNDPILKIDTEPAQKASENVEKIDEPQSEAQEKLNSDIEPEVIRMDSKPLESVSSADGSQNELPTEDNSKSAGSNESTKIANDEADRSTWEETTDKIAEKVTEQDANQRKVSVSSLIGDKDQVVDIVTTQTEAKSADDNISMVAKEEKLSENLVSIDQSVEDVEQKPVVKPETPAQSETNKQLVEVTKYAKDSDDTKSIDQNDLNNVSDESKKEESQNVDENKNNVASANSSENDLNENKSVSNENNDKIDIEHGQSENRVDSEQANTKPIEQNDVEKIPNETKTNESQSNEIVGNEIEKPKSPNTTENTNKSAISVQSESVNRNDNEQSETKLDLNMPDEASDDVYSTPPETGNGQNENSNEPNDEVVSKSGTDDKSKEEKSNSTDLPKNNANETNTSQDDSRENDENAKHESVIEISKPSSSKPEESNLVDEFKENQTVLPTENRASHTEGVNESMEKSTMPTEDESVDGTDGKNKKNQSIENVNSSSSDKHENTITNEKPPSVKSESIDIKAGNGIEQGNEYDAKSTNDDVASELSVSIKDEYEQAETEAIGDESVKDLDLSSNHELETNQANESAESDQQITALEIPPQNDNDSIDSPKQTQMQPDSLDLLVDSLDASLEPSVDADSLNIDSLDDKPRSAKSTDTGKLKDSSDSIIEEVSSPSDAKHETNDKTNKEDNAQPNELDRSVKNDTNNLTLSAVPKAKRSIADEPIETSSPEEMVMGDVVDYKSNPDIMHDQMKNELEVLRLAEKSMPIQMLGIAEVDSPLTPKQNQTTIFDSIPGDEKETINATEQLKDNVNQDSQLIELKNIESDIKIEDQNEKDDQKNEELVTLIDEKKAKDQSDEKFDEKNEDKFDEQQKSNTEFKDQNTSFSESASDSNINVITEDQTDQTEQSSEFYSTTIETSETQTSEDVIEVVEVVEIVEEIKCVKYLKPTSHDTPSSDLSDTDTTDKAEKVYTESGVDETSRDERDEVSEIENFDLSSCGEDSLEAMYYMIRKNEIIMDRHKETTSAKNCDDEKIIFPEKATDDLEHAVREVSGGKKVKLCSISMNSSVDDVILKKMSSDSDEIQIHVIPNSEIESSSEPKSCPLKEIESTDDDEYIDPIVDSMRKNEDAVNEMHAKALSVQPNRNDTQSDEQQLETDTFNEMDDMMPGNIARKILASSVSEADSDYFELPPTANRLTKDDFNVSTAFEHMIRTESTTDESDSTIESAATKIQAGARGFLTRRRIRKSSAGTSASTEKRSSIGNANIDKSLDTFIEQQELMDENVYSESFEESSPPNQEMVNRQTVDSVDSDKMLGITEIKVEQRKNEPTSHATNTANENNDEKVPEINIHIQGISEESATAQRRLMLQRGDAMQRNSTPESSEQQQQQQKQQQQQPQVDNDKLNKEPNNEENNQDAKNKHDDDPKIDAPMANASKSISKPLRGLGPRQRSMPVQIDSQLIRVLPKQVSKRVKSASSSSSKNHRPNFF